MKTSRKLFMAVIALAGMFEMGYTYIAVKKPENVSLQTGISLNLQTIAMGLRSPMMLAFPESGKILVADQIGVISLIENSTISTTPFLDLRSKMIKVNDGYDERGLLGLALHPNFKSNKKFYVYYSAPSAAAGSNHKAVISEFKVAGNGDQADMASERVILEVEEPESNHNGGAIKFGPDGYLYISFGDGGGAGDRHGTNGNGQNMSTLLGKIIRIDIDKGATYTVPPDNPFVANKEAKPEIWAYGLRNVWRFSFDRKSGLLFASDVGQDAYEEVNIIEKGGNYGWRIMEANHCFNPKEGCKIEGLKLPIDEYPHSLGISITGGYVYNGKAIPGLSGHYVFADWSGKLFNLHKSGTTWIRDNITLSNKTNDFRVLSFSEDTEGELYVLANLGSGTGDTRGVVYKLVK